MTKLLEKGIEAIRKTPEHEQDRAGELLLRMAAMSALHYHLTPDELSDIEEALAEVERGEIASDEQVAAMKRRHGLT